MTLSKLVIEEVISATPSTVWKAMTEIEYLKQWFFNIDNFELKEGFKFGFKGKGHNGETYNHICEILKIVPDKLLQFSWEYKEVNGCSVVTFELIEFGDHSKVILTHDGLDSFPSGNRDFELDSFKGGWTHIIGKELKKLF